MPKKSLENIECHFKAPHLYVATPTPHSARLAVISVIIIRHVRTVLSTR